MTIAVTGEERALEQIIKQLEKLVDVSQTTVTIEATGNKGKLDGFLLLLRPYGILELARTGLAALERGKLCLQANLKIKIKIFNWTKNI